MEKIYFSKKFPEEMIEEKKRIIFQFFNLHDLWWLKNSEFYRKSISTAYNCIFPDGRILSFKLGIPQQRGSSFTRKFLLNQKSKNKKHFFVGLENNNLKKISEAAKIPNENLSIYNPPYIKGIKFPDEEVKKIAKKINKKKPDYVWLCIGSPKQTILANQLFERTNKTKVKKFFCVGAGIDFFLGKKSEAPTIFTKIGTEWFYRLITDPQTTRKKAWRSFVAIKYLNKVKVR